MANEADEKYDDHEEGEYHFSDDHTSYDMDMESTQPTESTAIKESPFTKLKRYQRPLIAVGVFFILMIIVYKMLSPASVSQVTEDITQVAMKPKLPPQAPVVAVTSKIPTVSMPTPPANTPVPSSTSNQTMPVSPSVASASAPQTTTILPATSSTLPLPTAGNPAIPLPGTPVPPTSPSSSVVSYASQAMGNPPSEVKEAGDRVAALETQQAKLSNVIQIEYAQRISDLDTQSTATQAKLKELSDRVAGMEATLNQLTQLLQGVAGKGSSASSSSGLPATQSAGNRTAYTVQAIIPGRAWLKSDSGDTITVAEGDVLRDYGRITKIDPYDGVVSIDTGNKIISLSYGAGGDS